MTAVLDHIFVFVPPDAPNERQHLANLGLTETYQRAHPGQGTANVCYAFENAFLELLWLTDPQEAASAPIARTALAQRGQWRRNNASPFGIAWRLPPGHHTQPVPTWHYRPPYLPGDMSIHMAIGSQDPQHPLLFASPGKNAPSQWPAQRQQNLQRSGGFTRIKGLTLHNSPGFEPLDALATLGLVRLAPAQPQPKLVVHLGRTDGTVVDLELPSCTALA